ncbi:MAG: HPF/RaiA family ribosome-associated protein [Ilumatobacter sp.]|nr:HPF/RaiA family ribosome-associated protein [Ilumatobacter sp.]
MTDQRLTAAAEVLGAPIEFSTAGAISAGDRQAVVDLLDKILAPVDERATHIRVRMEHAADRNRTRATTVRIIVDFRRGAVRGSVSAATTRAAIDLLEDRLRAQLRHRAERRKARNHRAPSSGPGEWRHGDIPAERPPYFPRPVEERQVVKHKTVAPAASSVEEALFDLDSMDYDFYLYIDVETDGDAVVVRGTSTEPPRVQFLNGLDDRAAIDGVAVDQRPAPVHDVAGAKERLDVSDAAHLFFRDEETGRGHVLYRRFDGHYGLIVPADED